MVLTIRRAVQNQRKEGFDFDDDYYQPLKFEQKYILDIVQCSDFGFSLIMKSHLEQLEYPIHL